MYAMRVLLGFSLATALVCGQATTPTRPARPVPNATPNADSTPPKKPGTVEGVVTNSVNGRPVKKATIRLGQRSTVSDVAGHFLFENVEPGRYTASAVADGFTPEKIRGTGPFRDEPFTVAEEQHVKDVVLKLVPLASAGGRVLDQDGDPIAGAGVRAFQYGYDALGHKEMKGGGYATSNDLGEFKIMDLPPGRYYFGVTAPSPQASITGRSRGVEETYPVTYYPSGLDRAHATSVEVTVGAQLSNIDFRVRKIRSFSVRGKVMDASGQVRDVGVIFFSSGFDDTMYAMRPVQVQQDGSFQIGGVGSGSYSLIGARLEAVVRTFARQSIKVSDQDLDGVLLVLAPGLEITGTVQVEGSKASPTPDRNLARTVEKFHPRLELHDGMWHVETASVANDGSFVLHHVLPSLYQLSVYGLGEGKYLKSIRFNEREVPLARIDLTEQSGGTISLVFGSDGGQIEGSVQGKNGAPAVKVAIAIEPGQEFEFRRDLFRYGLTDKDGNFVVQDIAPGKYKVFAYEQFDSMDTQAPEFRKLLASRAVTITIAANGRESVKLKAISAEDIQAEKSKRP
jgi:hypothetical protein